MTTLRTVGCLLILGALALLAIGLFCKILVYTIALGALLCFIDTIINKENDNSCLK